MSAGDRIEALPLWHGRPRWQPLTGGLSNESFTVEDDTGRYVVRFGRDFPFHHVCRARELAMARAAHAAGFAPEIVHAGPGVMVSRFVEGRTYEAGDVRANLHRIAPLVRRFHDEMPRHVSGAPYMFWVFHVIRDYARTLADGESRMAPRLPEFLALSEEMERAQIAMPIVFGHHDFLPANLLDDGQRLWIIDFEYAGFGTAMFDLAGIASNAGFEPSQAEALLTAYLGQPPDQRFRRSHAAMQVASLLREAMWSMVSELHLDAPGVDYVAYTQANLGALDEALAAYRDRFGNG
jgi:thiamine kinase-like enzyme